MGFLAYQLSLTFRTGQGQPNILSTAFTPVKNFESREGFVYLVDSKYNPGKLRVIKSVRHEDIRFQPAEADALGKLTQLHTNIIRLICCEVNLDGFAHMLFEYCEGGDLAKQSNYRRATPLFALHVVISVAEALAFLHYGLVHRDGHRYERVDSRIDRVGCNEAIVHQDIKGDNVFLRFPGSQGGGLPDVVLADFGLARSASETVPGTGCVPYMSPESRFGSVERLSHKTDIYSFGVMCIGLLDHSATGLWNVYGSPRLVKLSGMYDGLHLGPLLTRCVLHDAAERGDFSEDPVTGMLPSIAEFRDVRTWLLSSGHILDRSYWAPRN
jgi:NIMA (never in mitosis gene a)-related kinase